MRLKQIIISVFLLSVYALSFAHSLMPHEHGFYSEHQPEFHDHDHQNHSDHIVSNDSHIHHKDHCDEGIVDLIVCVFNDLQHHNHDCDVENINVEKSKRFSSLSFNFFDGFIPTKYNPYSKTIYDSNLKSKPNKFDFENHYRHLPQDCASRRGPPIYFS